MGMGTLALTSERLRWASAALTERHPEAPSTPREAAGAGESGCIFGEIASMPARCPISFLVATNLQLHLDDLVRAAITKAKIGLLPFIYRPSAPDR
jgi:hypothetical protein